MLLENIDSNGVIRHALIDSGFSINFNGIRLLFQKHNVKKLEFFCITHYHGDHIGSALYFLNTFPVDLIIMKEFDDKWSPGGDQSGYEKIIMKAIDKNIKILGVSYVSLGSSEYSPSRSETFKTAITKAKEENFIYFNESNTKFQFGSAMIRIMNWQIFDIEGNLYITGKSTLQRDIYSGENQNSLGVLLFQGNKKAFFSGDINNTKKKVGGELIGDEDRIKNDIGKIDFLKLGHHGNYNSNTADYLSVLSPENAIISNEIGNPYNPTIFNLEEKQINYLYTIQDQYEVCAVIYNDEVTLGFGSAGIKRVKDEIFYIPENKVYSNYLKSKINVQYDYIEKTVNNWEELKTTIEQFQSGEGIYIQNNCFVTEGLIITLNKENNSNIYNANSSILVNNLKKIKIVTNQNEIIIKRDEALIDLPLFQIKRGLLSLGEENMKGKIIIDGNKDNVVSSSQLITINDGELSIYDNIILCNNLLRIIDLPTTVMNYGSAILAKNNSTINMYGGEISNNIQEMLINKNSSVGVLPESMTENLVCDNKGVIYLFISTLNMCGGKICNNQCINNSDIYSNENSTNNDVETAYSVYQRCYGGVIYADYVSKVYLHKGEISDNITQNNSKINLITPKVAKKTKVGGIDHNIYGSAIFGYYCF